MNRYQAVDELKRVYTVLSDDLESALRIGRADPSQFAHRTLFRTYFAFVEGLAFQLRQVTLASLAQTDLLSSAELALLREERFQLNRKGEPEHRENYQAFLPSLLFSVRCYVKNHGAQYLPDTSNNGWASMQKASAARDRLTHPKSAAGLDVTDEDTEVFGAAAAWWKGTLLEMFAACGEADNFFRERLASGRLETDGTP